MHFVEIKALCFIRIKPGLVLKGSVDNKSAMVQVIARRRSNAKLFSEPMCNWDLVCLSFRIGLARVKYLPALHYQHLMNGDEA